MGKRITIDPITRIEGHLRVDVQVDGGKVSSAWSSGTMWRGLETILQGRDPRDAWVITQRICGVCTTVHAIASIRSVESALNVEVPKNAQYVRNIMMAQHSVQDHIVHFYQLSALDWVDVLSALKADPRKASEIAQSLSDWPGNSYKEFKAVQERLKDFAAKKRLGIFGSGYWGHPAMRLPPEINLMAVAHYLKAIDYQRKGAQAVAVLGGKNPHIQNLCLGGVATAINPDNQAALNMERLAFLRSLMEESRAFVKQVLLPDALAVAGAYHDYFGYGQGHRNYLAVPEFPEDTRNTQFALPGGISLNGGASGGRRIATHQDKYVIDSIRESAAHSWYKDPAPYHPWEGRTEPDYTDFDADRKYSWVKAPRFEGRVMEVGPVAQVLAAYHAGVPAVKTLADKACGLLKIQPSDLGSTMGRIAARAIRASVMADLSLEYLDKLEANLAAGDTVYANPVEIPEGEYRGVGFHEAPRGTLSHWIVIRDKKIANYQAVVPSTWNASPRDEKGNLGPYEACLVGNPVADTEQPLEVLRAIHSFDPCLACAIHTLDPEGRELVRVKAL